MARKSVLDLIRQTNRIMSNPNITQERRRRAYDAYQRYASQIGRSKSFVNAYNKAGRDFDKFIGVNRGSNYQDARQEHQDNTAMSRKYSMSKHAQYARLQRAQGLNGG